MREPGQGRTSMLLIILCLVLVVISTALAFLVVVNQGLLRAERRRSAERAAADALLIASLQGLADANGINAEAQTRRAEAAEDLARVQGERVRLLSESPGLAAG